MAWPPNKYVRGRPLTFHEVVRELLDGHYVFYHHRAMHPSVVRNWSLNSLWGGAAVGAFRQAEINPKYVAPPSPITTEFEDVQ